MAFDDLVARARDSFVSRFGYPPHAIGVAPGRVELLGNHTDYNDGFVLTAAIDRGTALALSARETPQARLCTESESFPDAIFDALTMEKAIDGTRWTNYIRGVVDELRRVGVNIAGFDGFVASTVPDGAGVSSSAALLVAAAQAFLATHPHPMPLGPMDVAKLCRRAENGRFVNAPVGLLDQFSSACGLDGQALLLDCRSFEFRSVSLPSERAAILIANSNVKHELAAGGGYTTRRAQCEQAARLLTDGASEKLRDVSVEMFEEKSHLLEPELALRARHIVYENLRVEMGAQALEAGNLATFGEAMNNTHESCRRFFDNSCPEVDALVETAQSVSGVWGAKLTGGGWGGSAVIVHDPACADTLMERLSETFSRRFGHAPTLLPTRASAGATSVLAEG